MRNELRLVVNDALHVRVLKIRFERRALKHTSVELSHNLADGCEATVLVEQSGHSRRLPEHLMMSIGRIERSMAGATRQRSMTGERWMLYLHCEMSFGLGERLQTLS
jgi:hypothetical protein